MKSDLEKKLEHMNPKKLTPKEKSYMWSHINSKISTKAVGSSRFNFRKFAFIPALITAFIAGSLGTAFAFADSATPGDFLFPVDIAAEKILLTLTFGDSNDELHLRFSEERLDEVKSILALAEAAQTTPNTDDSTATSTDNGTSDDDSNATTTPDGTNDDTGTSTTTDNGTNNNDDNDGTGNEVDPVLIDKAQVAFLVALAHLESARASLLDKENELGVAVIDDMIAELTALAEDHVANLQEFKVKIKENDDKIKISIEIKTDEIKTKFKFEQDLDGGDDETKIEVSANSSGSKIKIDDGEFKISQSVKEQGESTQESSKRKNNRVKICHTSFGKHGRKETKKVSEFSLEYYLDRGDTLGECEDDDDDDDSDRDNDEDEDGDDEDDDGNDKNKKIKICHKGKKTLEVSISAQWAHLGHGDTKGRCDDDGDDNDDNGDEDSTPPIISNISASVGITSAEISWNTDEDTTSKIWYSTSTPVVLDSPTPFASSGTFESTHTMTLNSLTASTTYYIVVVATDDTGNSTESLERTITTDGEPDPGDATPPVLSGIASEVRIAAADISWNTDENADSTVWFSEISPVTPSFPTDFVSSGSLLLSHFLTINGLTASTTYFFIVESKDSAGNIATSSEQSFATSPPSVDDIPPVISSITATPTTTEATIMWDTDEEATSKVIYSESSPIDPDTDPNVEDGSFLTTHQLSLTSLIPDTTYYYLVVGADAEGNTATSSEQNFTTDPEAEPADETAPIISVIVASDIASTTVTVSWSTDEDADSTLYYGIDDPLDIETASVLTSGSLTQDHSFNLSSLSASTTYQYIVVSSDESGNFATSSQQSFLTLGE